MPRAGVASGESSREEVHDRVLHGSHLAGVRVRDAPVVSLLRLGVVVSGRHEVYALVRVFYPAVLVDLRSEQFLYLIPVVVPLPAGEVRNFLLLLGFADGELDQAQRGVARQRSAQVAVEVHVIILVGHGFQQVLDPIMHHKFFEVHAIYIFERYGITRKMKSLMFF